MLSPHEADPDVIEHHRQWQIYREHCDAAAKRAERKVRKLNPLGTDEQVDDYMGRWWQAWIRVQEVHEKYSPDATFSDRINWLGEWEDWQKKREREKAKKPAGKVAEKQAAIDAAAVASLELGERFKFVLNAGCFWDVVQRQLVKKESVFSFAFPYCAPDQPPSALVLKNIDNHYDRLAYAPTKPAIYTDAAGLRCLNRYQPSALQPLDGDASPWLDHVALFFGDDVAEREHFLSWLAYKVQFPERKVRHGCILQSPQGHGKGVMARPLFSIFGDSNVVAPENDEILKGKLGFLEEKLLVIVHELKAENNKFVADKLKPVISEDTIRIELKYANPYRIENPASVLCFTNHENALYLEDSDRRWFIYASKIAKQTPAYFKQLHDWIDGEGSALVYGFLKARDLDGFNPNAHPPMTKAKAQTIESSRGETRNEMVERFEDRRAPFDRDVLKLNDALARLRLDLPKASRNMLISFLREQKGEPFADNNPTRYTRNGTQCQDRLWIIRDVAKWRAASKEALGEEINHGHG